MLCLHKRESTSQVTLLDSTLKGEPEKFETQLRRVATTLCLTRLSMKNINVYITSFTVVVSLICVIA